MFARKSRFTIVMMWAMVPLVVFGSQPRMGCVCADGQHKSFCERHRQGTNTGECVCCGHGNGVASSMASAAKSATPAGQSGCCRRQNGAGCSSTLAFDTGRPCHPVLDQPVTVAVAKTSLDLDQADHTPIFVALEPQAVIADSVVAVDVALGEPFPPPDLVITLGVMLI